MKKEIKRNIITKNANQTSKTAFKKMQNLNLTAMIKNYSTLFKNRIIFPPPPILILKKNRNLNEK